jgi:hypothetical protein
VVEELGPPLPIFLIDIDAICAEAKPVPRIAARLLAEFVRLDCGYLQICGVPVSYSGGTPQVGSAKSYIFDGGGGGT